MVAPKRAVGLLRILMFKTSTGLLLVSVVGRHPTSFEILGQGWGDAERRPLDKSAYLRVDHRREPAGISETKGLWLVNKHWLSR